MRSNSGEYWGDHSYIAMTGPMSGFILGWLEYSKEPAHLPSEASSGRPEERPSKRQPASRAPGAMADNLECIFAARPVVACAP
jgi:hypothetical protein